MEILGYSKWLFLEFFHFGKIGDLNNFCNLFKFIIIIFTIKSNVPRALEGAVINLENQEDQSG